MAGLNVRQCKLCNQLFQPIHGSVCGECLNKMEENASIVREYLHEHRGASVFQISAGTGIEERVILYLLKEGVLILDNGVDGLQCERCGATIASGKICESCRKRMNSMLGQAVVDMGGVPQSGRAFDPDLSRRDERTGPRMHLNRKRED